MVISILPKTFDEMEIDVHMPERLGIYQSVGDTAGPGGMMRALRTLPMFVEFAEAIRKYCPNAWVINYTNPMSLCVKTLYEVFPQIKAFGCCHEVFGTQKVLAGIAEKELGIGKIERHDIHVNVLGINHFTWFDYASYKGIDLFRRYGLIAAAGDRHLAEFMPGGEYLKNPETVKSWKFGLTTVAWRKEDLKKRLERSKRLVSGEEQIELKPTGEEGILLMKALCGLERVVSNVNIPNRGCQIANLPESAVVETNAVFERDAIRPVLAGSVPEPIRQLIMPHITNHERIMKVVMGGNKDVDLVAEAFLNDPLVKGRASEEDVRKLVKDMMKATLEA